MRISRLFAVAALILTPSSAWAEDYDGSKPLICASVDTLSCAPGEDCLSGTVEDLNVPQFFHVDFDDKQIEAKRPDGEERISKIDRQEVHEGELILQGMQGGLGWTAAITLGTGKMSLTASGDRIAFIIFGACTPL